MGPRGDFRRLLGYLRPYRGRVAAALLLSFGTAGFTCLSLSTLKPILNTLFTERGLERLQEGTRRIVGAVSPPLAERIVAVVLPTAFAALASLLLAVLLFTVAKGILRFLNEYLVGTVAVAASRDLTNELFAKLVRQPVLFFEREGVGTVAGRFTADADEVVRGLKTLTGTLFREPLQFLFLLALALLISPLLTAAALVIFPVIGFLIRRVGKVAERTVHRVLTHRGRLLSIVQEVFFGIRAVQAFRAEDRERRRYRDENERLFQRYRRLVRIEAVASPAMEILVVLGVGGALLLGGAMAIEGDLEVGSLVLFYAAIGALYEPVRKLGSAVPRLKAGLAGAHRIFRYLDREPEVREREGARDLPPLAGAISLEGVRFTYGGRGPALCGLSLTIRAGETLAIVGPSGSGKTTLAALLLRFFDPEEGAVRFDGVDLREATLASIRSQVALVAQETVLMDASIRDNIAYGRPDATEAEIRRAARLAHVEEFAERLPEGYDTVIAERGAALSGGQRQRIAIARALLAEPRVLVLDEAVSNVDEESARLIRRAVESTAEGRTTIHITHRVDTLARAPRIAVLHRGRLEACGTHEELLAASPTYRELVQAADAERIGTP